MPSRPRRLSTLLAAACLALLASCAPTVPARPPIAEPVAAPAPEVPTSGPTIAERAARYNAVTQQVQSTSRGAPEVSAGADYQNGYPRMSQAPRARADRSLQSFLALNTGPYLANHNVHDLTWTNNSGRTLSVYKVYLWTGVDKGAIADVHVEARRLSDDSYLGILQWDHYADPTVPQHGQQFDYPSPMLLDPGDGITFLHFANGFTPGWHAHHVVILWVK